MNYSEIFESIGLTSETPSDYAGADQYAKKFTRCSVLTYDHVSYSGDTKYSNENNKNKEVETLKTSNK